ncbi:MAG: glycosyltransferase family 2 protein [Candidatus Methylomirabilales bacterium]
MTRHPLVSVLMTAYNGEPYLGEAVQSILNQTVQDFEFLIIDNASTDGSRDVVLAFRDPRIRLISNPENLGPPRALNQGLRLAVGEYVARMDADDVALPDRLEKQLDFMERNPLCAVLGTQATLIDHVGRKIYTPWHPVTPHAIRWKMMFASPLAHPSVIMRRDDVLAVGGYHESLRHCADYRLRSTLVSRGHQITNFDQQHMLMRVHPGGGMELQRRERIW